MYIPSVHQTSLSPGNIALNQSFNFMVLICLQLNVKNNSNLEKDSNECFLKAVQEALGYVVIGTLVKIFGYFKMIKSSGKSKYQGPREGMALMLVNSEKTHWLKRICKKKYLGCKN